MPEPHRPAITPAQVAASLLAAIPIAANLLHVFGVYNLSPEQQNALTSTMQWAFAVAGVLTVSDAGLRAARNHAHAKVAAAPRPPVPIPTVWSSGTSNVPAGNVPTTPIGDDDALPDVPTTPADEVPADEGDAGNTP